MHITDDRLDRAGTYLLRFDGGAWIAIQFDPPPREAELAAVFTPVDERTIDKCLRAITLARAGNEAAAMECVRAAHSGVNW